MKQLGPARWHTRAVVVGAVLASVSVCSCGTSSATSQPAATKSMGGSLGQALPTPLATSVEAGGGTWATVPMGKLTQPLNTFWQLFYRSNGSSSWSDKVQATAVATNGGLVLAAARKSLSVGVRPSNDLTFSPIISTVDSGRSWSNGLLTQGLAAHPEALATGPGGTALAIVDGRRGGEVLNSTQGLSSWQPLVSTNACSRRGHQGAPAAFEPSLPWAMPRGPQCWERAASVRERRGYSSRKEPAGKRRGPTALLGRPKRAVPRSLACSPCTRERA